MAGSDASELGRRDWFLFSDYERFSPINGSQVVTHQFRLNEVGRPDSPDWVKDEWKTDAVLVPLTETQRCQDIRHLLGEHYVACDLWFSPSWDERGFDFGNAASLYGLSVEPWISKSKHLISRKLQIVPRPDFVTYHMLEVKPGSGSAIDYDLPITGQTILRTRTTNPATYYEEQAYAEVNLDYLRDFLSARRAVMLISVVADRFLNAPTVESLELQDDLNQRLGDYMAIQTTVSSTQATRLGFARGRSSYYWNILIEPYAEPNERRSYWPNFGFESAPPPGETDVTFYASSTGSKITAAQAGPMQYFYFQPAVLQKYLSAEGYSSFFHMRQWGAAADPRQNSVDVGLNSRGLLTAYGPDIAKLARDDQAYWASYSAVPDGEICDELFQTRMQQSPPHSPSVIDLLQDARESIGTSFRSAFGADLFRAFDPLDREKQHMSVGPILKQDKELAELVQSVYDWLIDSMDFETLRQALQKRAAPFDADWRQLKLLEQLLASYPRIGPDRAHDMVQPLHLVRTLRVMRSHPQDRGVEDIFLRFDLNVEPFRHRAAWDALVDVVSGTLRGIIFG